MRSFIIALECVINHVLRNESHYAVCVFLQVRIAVCGFDASGAEPVYVLFEARA
jgi:hypothetical protein